MKGGDTMENEKDVASEVATAASVSSSGEEIRGSEESGTTEENPLVYRKRKRRLGDRRDGRKLHTIQPMHRVMPYIMPKRSDALNTFYDRLEVSRVDELCRRKYMDVKVVTDERICDGHYFASAFKYFKKLIEHPDLLEKRPDKVIEDIE